MVYLALAEHRQFNSPVKQQQQQMCVNLQLEVFFGVMECGSAVPSTEQIIIQLSRQEREEKKSTIIIIIIIVFFLNTRSKQKKTKRKHLTEF